METQICAKDAAHELIALSCMSGDQIKREMDANYLSILVADHPTLEKKYFLDFITKCQLTGADPRLGQAYLVTYNAWSKERNGYVERGQTVFDYKFLIMKAQETGELGPIIVDSVEDEYLDLFTGKRKPSYTATAIVDRKGRQSQFKARYWEFCKKDNNSGMPIGNWRTMQRFMIEKCAVACALRIAFPEALGSIYIEEEMQRVIHEKESIKPKQTYQKPQLEQLSNVVEHSKQELQQEPKPEPEPLKIKLSDNLDLEHIEEKALRDELSLFWSTVDERVIKAIGKDRGVLLAWVITEQDIDKLKTQYRWLVDKFCTKEEVEVDRNEITEGEPNTEIV